MRVKDLMITDVVKVKPETSLQELLKKFVEYRIGGVPVVNEQNQLVGMVSDGDILRFLKPISAKNFNFFTYYMRIDEVPVEERISTQLDKPVKECMKGSGLVTISVEDDLEAVVTVLSNHHFKKIPVLDQDHQVVGVISRGDVMRYIVQQWIK